MNRAEGGRQVPPCRPWPNWQPVVRFHSATASGQRRAVYCYEVVRKTWCGRAIGLPLSRGSRHACPFRAEPHGVLLHHDTDETVHKARVVEDMPEVVGHRVENARVRSSSVIGSHSLRVSWPCARPVTRSTGAVNGARAGCFFEPVSILPGVEEGCYAGQIARGDGRERAPKMRAISVFALFHGLPKPPKVLRPKRSLRV